MRFTPPLLLALLTCAQAHAEAEIIVYDLPAENRAFIQLPQHQGTRFKLTLPGEEIVKRGDEIVCEPGTRVRRPYYLAYRFDAAAFEAAFPEYQSREKVVVEGIVEAWGSKTHEVPVGAIRLYEVKAKLLATPTLPQRIYALDSILEAQFDAQLIAQIDSIPPPYPKGSAYQIGAIPTKAGAGKIYKFIATHPGAVSYQSAPATIHQLLMLQIDGSGHVIEGYHYTLEWQDAPSLRLFAVTTKGVKLVDGLEVHKLGLKNGQGQEWQGGGLVRLKP